MQVSLGNSVAKEAFRESDGALQHRPIDGDQVTTVQIPDEYTLGESLQCITAGDGVWANHAQHDENGKPFPPAWVESDSPALTLVLAESFGGIPTSRPEGWGEVSIPTDVEVMA